MPRAEAADQGVQRRLAGPVKFGPAIVIGADAAEDRGHERDHAAGRDAAQQGIRDANGADGVGQEQAGDVGIGNLIDPDPASRHDAGVQEQHVECLPF